MIKWKCKNCGEEREHIVKKTDQDKYTDYKILICQYCSEKEMVPGEILKNQNNQSDFSDEKNIGSDGGFNRDVGGGCEDGICPVR